jgi:hypothetical protein
VIGASWAKSALSISQSASPPWSFQALYAALAAAWLQEQEEIEARQIDGRSSAGPENLTVPQVPGMFFQGQGVYGRPRQPGSRSSAPNKEYSAIYPSFKTLERMA